METATQKPYNWLKELSPALLQLDEVPLFGKAPPFPWEKLSSALGRIFADETIQIEPIDTRFRNPNELTKGIGSPIALNIAFPSLEGELCWILSKNDLSTLMKQLLTKDPDSFLALDENFKSGFYRFLAAQVIDSINKLDFDKNLNPTLSENTGIPDKASLGIDVAIKIKNSSVTGRVIIPSQLLQAWKERHANRKVGFTADSSMAQKIQVIIHIEAGKTTLKKSEWSKVSPGDFVLLDTCTYEPDSDKGRVMLTIDGQPIFRAKLKQGNIKILEFPLYYEVDNPMNNPDDDFEDFDEDIEHEDSSDFDEEELTEEEPEEEDQAAEEQEEEPQVEEGKKGLKPENLPITLVVEVARIQMSLQKLMELQPGNTLELNIRPEDGVDLVANGKRIAKGELLKIGEALGVRILDIA